MCFTSLSVRLRHKSAFYCPSSMSVTVHQILNDAKRLVNRLREHDASADNIILQTNALCRTIECKKEYYEDLNEQHDQLHNTKPLFVFSVQQENKHIRELQQENRELHQLLEEHQSVLELIMSKYRVQISKMIEAKVADDMNRNNPNLQELQLQTDRICKMAAIMKESMDMDESSYTTEHENLMQLVTENKGLRELLEISNTFGSLYVPIISHETADKEVQTGI